MTAPKYIDIHIIHYSYAVDVGIAINKVLCAFFDVPWIHVTYQYSN